jgi:hypothetical protein
MVHGDGTLRRNLTGRTEVSRSQVAISAKRCCYHLEIVSDLICIWSLLLLLLLLRVTDHSPI